MTDLSRFLPPSPPRTKGYYLDREFARPGGPRFYECGCCGAMHALCFDGDCREDAARLDVEDDICVRFGDGWEEVPMPGAEDDEETDDA